MLVDEPAAVFRHRASSRSCRTPTSGRSRRSTNAALVQLDLLLAALRRGIEVLKDSTPDNVQFRRRAPGVRGHRLLPSGCARASPGSATASSACSTCTRCSCRRRRTCRSIPGCAGSIDGIRPADRRRCFGSGTVSGVACSRTSSSRSSGSRSATQPPSEVKDQVERRGLDAEIVMANVRKMRKMVERHDWEPADGVWTAYGERERTATPTMTRGARTKSCAGRHVAHSGPRLGHRREQRSLSRSPRRGTDGRGGRAPTRVRWAAAGSPGPARQGDLTLTLTMNRPTRHPGSLARLERRSMPDRGKPDLVLALALIHHVAISAMCR